jgi:hypothetical protein
MTLGGMKMRNPGRKEVCASVLLLGGLVACEDKELEWDTARNTVGAIAGDRIEGEKEWRDYRENAVRSLDEMKALLSDVREQTAVDERLYVDGLTGRIETLRQDIISEMDGSAEQAATTRMHLEETFEGLRNETNALLTQLGHDPEEFGL